MSRCKSFFVLHVTFEEALKNISKQNNNNNCRTIPLKKERRYYAECLAVDEVCKVILLENLIDSSGFFEEGRP